MHLPSMPIWFDPTLPGEARGYVGAVWLAVSCPGCGSPVAIAATEDLDVPGSPV
jgi:hypothetical protein